MDHSLTGLPEDNGEAAEANRRDREARSIAIEKVNYTNQSLNLYCKKSNHEGINNLQFHSSTSHSGICS